MIKEIGMDDPLKSMIKETGDNLSQREHSDIVLNNGIGKQFHIEPANFSEIKNTSNPHKIAFVDGGNGTLGESPNYLMTINRVYYSLFQGKKRIKPKTNTRIQFYSRIISNIQTQAGKKTISYNTKLFTHSPKDKKFLPDESDLISNTEGIEVFPSEKLDSQSRRFAEWQMAIHTVETELKNGDMLVMDGSLQTQFKNESRYSNKLYDLAKEKGVTVCGLSKTCRLVTESGHPLLARIAEISKNVSFKRWYVKIAEKVTADDRGFMMVVKLHPQSKFVFRFEILQEQFAQMNDTQINAILSSLAENSQDVAMLGYPYGAIDTDRFAQVRHDELGMYQGFILSEKLRDQEWEKLQKDSTSLEAHNDLNGVTS